MAAIGHLLANALKGLWSVIGPALIAVLIDKIKWAVIAWKRRGEITAQVRAEREAIEAAKTKEERDRAAENNRL